LNCAANALAHYRELALELYPYRPFDDVYDLQSDISINFKLL
jgi:hypothetical protein